MPNRLKKYYSLITPQYPLLHRGAGPGVSWQV